MNEQGHFIVNIRSSLLDSEPNENGKYLQKETKH